MYWQICYSFALTLKDVKKIMSNCGCHDGLDPKGQYKVLVTLLVINGFMFLFEFVFGCRRCDLNGGDPEVMFNTLRHLKETLSGSTVIHPGHNYAVTPTATMEYQIEGNPFMHFDKRQDFVEFRQHVHSRIRSTPYMK